MDENNFNRSNAFYTSIISPTNHKELSSLILDWACENKHYHVVEFLKNRLEGHIIEAKNTYNFETKKKYLTITQEIE